VESYAFPTEGRFNLEEYGRFLYNRNLQIFFENLRLLGNKIHGLKGSCGFLVPQAKLLCHKVEDITRPLSEQNLVLTKDISYLLKQVIFKIQDILELYQDDPETEINVDDWLDHISGTLERGRKYLEGQLEAFNHFLSERSVDRGEIRQRRTEEYLSVSLKGYELLAEQTKELYYSLSDSLVEERAILSSSLYNQFLQTHQEIKKVPLDLSRYERLIPKLAKEYGKEADLLIEDHQVKADREFWNAVHEILNHVLKNAVIHGLEKPEERTAQGKDRTGKVGIKLSEDALHILLSISDDGRGINTDGIVEKALSNNVITREQLEMMSEKEILNLLFVQGVSTAENLDDNAGRGVGMNAVEEAMHQFHGTCRIETHDGKGCSYHFSFAKNNVSLPCIIVAIDDVHIAIPEDNVESFINYQREDSFMLKRQISYQYNDSAVPLIDFEKVFEINKDPEERDQNQLIILKSKQGNTGLVINDILHHAVMPILPLPKIYRQTPIYLGITIFKDTPVQVIDVEKLI
jgi:chemotaxis protein histidine kinase CheA